MNNLKTMFLKMTNLTLHATSSQQSINQSNYNCTFSERCITIHIREKDQQDAHLFSLIYSNKTILYMFRTNNCSPSGGYFCTQCDSHTVLAARNPTDTW